MGVLSLVCQEAGPPVRATLPTDLPYGQRAPVGIRFPDARLRLVRVDERERRVRLLQRRCRKGVTRDVVPRAGLADRFEHVLGNERAQVALGLLDLQVLCPLVPAASYATRQGDVVECAHAARAQSEGVHERLEVAQDPARPLESQTDG